jgi:hypothetical protein
VKGSRRFIIRDTHLRENCGENLDLLRVGRNFMLPVHLNTCLANHGHQVECGICLSETVMGSCAEHKPVLGVLLSITTDPSFRIKSLGLGVCNRVVKSGICRRNDHRSLLGGVCIGDGEVLLDEVRNHEYGRTVAKLLLDNCSGVGHRLEHIHGQASISVTLADTHVLLAQLLENIGAVGNNLEQPSGGTAGGILGSEKEGEESLGDFVVGESADKHGGLLRVVHLDAAGQLGAVGLGVDHLLDPGIKNAVDFTTNIHADLCLCGTLCELVENHVGSLLAVPSLCEGDDDGEVDKLESSGYHVIVVCDLLDGLVADVVPDKSSAGNGAQKLSELGHEGDGLVASILGDLEEASEVCIIDLLLTGQVQLESLAGEETVETLAVVDMSLAIEEDPVGRTKEFVGDINDAGLDVGGGVEDLAGHVACRGNNDELVENGDTAQGTTLPFGVVLFEFGVDRLEERSDEGHLEHGAYD